MQIPLRNGSNLIPFSSTTSFDDDDDDVEHEKLDFMRCLIQDILAISIRQIIVNVIFVRDI